MSYLKNVRKELSLGKVEEAKRLLDLGLKQDHKEAFYKSQREDYKALGYEIYTVIKPLELDAEGIVVSEEVGELLPAEGSPSYEEYRDELIQNSTELVRPYVEPSQAEIDDLVVSKYRELAMTKSVTMRQARLALLQNNLLSIVEESIANGTDEEMKIEWEYATTVDRNWNSLVALTSALGMTSDQLDDLFILASRL